MAFEGRSGQSFIVRRARSLDDLQWVTRLAVEEGYCPREREAECYFSAGLLSDFFIGELNGERISCICVVRHGESVAFVGYYIVDKPYRRRGYGLKTWKAALADIGDQCNGQLVAVLNMKDQYQKSGFQPGWLVKRYSFTASRALDALASTQQPSSVAQILPASKVDFEKVIAYGADMLGKSQACRLVLAAWLSHAQESSWVALGNKDEVIGYLIMSKTVRFEEEGYRVAPFFANSVPIARNLLKVAVEFASRNNPEQIMFLDVAADFNPEGVSILENEIGAKSIFDTIFMSTKEIPTKPHCKVFGIGSCEVM